MELTSSHLDHKNDWKNHSEKRNIWLENLYETIEENLAIGRDSKNCYPPLPRCIMGFWLSQRQTVTGTWSCRAHSGRVTASGCRCRVWPREPGELTFYSEAHIAERVQRGVGGREVEVPKRVNQWNGGILWSARKFLKHVGFGGKTNVGTRKNAREGKWRRG